MRSWIKTGLLTALVFGACWGGSVWRWRATNRMPANGDLVLWLLALPLALLLAFWLGRWLLVMTTASAAPAVPAATLGDLAAAVPPQTAPLAIIAVSLHSPHGASPEQLAGAFADNLARAALDAELVDADGFPVMSARSGDVADAALQEDVMAWLLENGMAELRLSEPQWRALTMATGVAADLASAAADLLPAGGVAPTLQLIPLLPAEWPIAQRRAIGRWLQHTVVQFGWPAASIGLEPEVPLEARGADPAALLGRLAYQAGASDAPLVAVLLACGSQLSQENVDAWSDSGVLFTASHQQGLIPGEGAAGLLLTDLHRARALDGVTGNVLHAVSVGRRDVSADDSRRADPTLLSTLVEQVLARGATLAPAVVMIVADTGHRGNRALELMAVADAAVPQLDTAVDVLCAGAASGTCGAVPLITALALAHYHALERAAPVLCMSNEDPYRRCVALIGPALPVS